MKKFATVLFAFLILIVIALESCVIISSANNAKVTSPVSTNQDVDAFPEDSDI